MLLRIVSLGIAWISIFVVSRNSSSGICRARRSEVTCTNEAHFIFAKLCQLLLYGRINVIIIAQSTSYISNHGRKCRHLSIIISYNVRRVVEYFEENARMSSSVKSRYHIYRSWRGWWLAFQSKVVAWRAFNMAALTVALYNPNKWRGIWNVFQRSFEAARCAA